MDPIAVGDPKFGILVYKNMLPSNLDLVNRLENVMKENEGKNNVFKWSPAMVGDQQIFPEYRDCFDFRIAEQHVNMLPNAEFKSIFSQIKNKLNLCLMDYQKRYNVEMNYMEAINFVKYGQGQHFQVHSDHGFSYVCTISSVAYLNDDYEGGELYFPNFDVTFTPELGDIVFFPSAFIYGHASLPVKSGVKYSAVTMFDFNDRNHREYGARY